MNAEPGARLAAGGAPGRLIHRLIGFTALPGAVAKILIASALFSISSFAVVAPAPKVLSVAEFAHLAIILSLSVTTSLVLDLGGNITAIREFVRSERQGFLQFNMTMRLGILGVLLAAFTLSALNGGAPVWLTGFLAGASISMWTGIQSTDQARGRYGLFAIRTSVFSLLRVICGWAALTTGRADLVALGIFVAPLLLMVAWGLARGEIRPLETVAPDIRTYGYAFWTYVSGTAYAVAPNLPQLFLRTGADPVSVGTFGIVLSYVGPMILVSNSARTYLLPEAIRGGGSDAVSRYRKIYSILFGLCAAVGVGACAFLLQSVYGDRFPKVGTTFLVFGLLFGAALVIGFGTVRVHSLGIPHQEAVVNIVRLVTLYVALTLTPHSVLWVSAVTGVTMVIFQLILQGVITLAERRAAKVGAP